MKNIVLTILPENPILVGISFMEWVDDTDNSVGKVFTLGFLFINIDFYF